MRKNRIIKVRRKNILNVLILLFLVTIQGFANANDVPSIFDELSYQETLEVTLEMDMEAVFANRRNKEKHKTVFTFIDKNNLTQTWNINVTLRGRYRRTRCEGMAPLKLNFKKRDLKEAGLAKFDDMKLVTHCVANKKEAKRLLAKEYATYKIFNQISEESFRVQFLKINYKDSKTGTIDQQWGILIEDTAELRARINVEKTKKLFNLDREFFHIDAYKTVAFFQYMIGNPDWSSNRVHNVKLLTKGEKYIIVPYDFDFSGIVDAPYASVNSELQIASNKDRIYLGFQEDLENYEETIQLYSSKKEDMLNVIRDCDVLTRKSRREMIKYINSFYGDLENINYPLHTVTVDSTPGE